jgi:hypothetical protein
MEMTIDFTNISDQIKKKTYVSNEITYNIYNNYRNNTDETLSLFRSIITNDDNHKILCFAPPSLLEMNNFIEKYPSSLSIPNNDILINELIEGTMINLFYDERISSWEISTRSILKANNWYYKMDYNDKSSPSQQKTFRQMFMEHFSINEDMNTIFKSLPKNCCYSFVLQHPDNHIVLNIQTTKVYLVAIYCINNNNIKFISPLEYEYWGCFDEFKNNKICFPIQFTDQKYSFTNLLKQCSLPSYDTGVINNDTRLGINPHIPLTMGFVLTNLNTGERTMVINKTYEELKVLRGNHVNLEYYYYTLRQNMNQLNKFLYYFPRYNDLFSGFKSKIFHFVKTVQNYYYEFYIKKNKNQIPKKYFIHVSKLHHELHIPLKKIITLNVVKEYFDGFTPKQMYMYIHYNENHNEHRKNKDKETDTTNLIEFSNENDLICENGV